MITFILTLLDILLVLFVILFLMRLTRALVMRGLFMRKLKAVCKKKQFTLQIHRFPFLSIFWKSSKVDLTVTTSETVYHVKFLTSLSSKKVLHFIDETNYISYLKTFTALPMATKVSEHIQFASFHRLPTIKQKVAGEYVLLFHPTPNNITAIVNGILTEIGNGTQIGQLRAYNGRGFCSMLGQIMETEST